MGAVAQTSEDLRNYTTYSIVSESATMFWVGDAPRLSTDDDAASYVQIGPNVSTGIATVTFAPFTVTGDITLRARVRVFGGDFGASTLFLSDEAGQTAVDFLFEDHVIDTGAWVTIESTFSQADVVSGGLGDSAAAGTLTAGIFPGYVLDATYYWVSLLEIAGGDRPLRWKQRDDGLGTYGVPAAKGRTSAQRTNRAGPRSYY